VMEELGEPEGSELEEVGFERGGGGGIGGGAEMAL